VRVKEVDVGRKRIALTMKSGVIEAGASRSSPPPSQPRFNAAPRQQAPSAPADGALAAALRRAQEKGR
jgi:uncharacterized protein